MLRDSSRIILTIYKLFPIAFSVATLITLAGCQQVWVKPGASQSDLDADSYACLQQTQQQPSAAVNFGGVAPEILYNAKGYVYDKCMNEKGWTLQNAPTNAQQNTNLNK